MANPAKPVFRVIHTLNLRMLVSAKHATLQSASPAHKAVAIRHVSSAKMDINFKMEEDVFPVHPFAHTVAETIVKVAFQVTTFKITIAPHAWRIVFNAILIILVISARIHTNFLPPLTYI